MGATSPDPINGQTGFRAEAAAGALAAVVSVAAAAAPLLAHPGLFLTDDYATQFMPAFREIARLLSHGQFPLLTGRLWEGGALLQEYQYAVFNPVSLVLYLIIAQTSDMALGAAIYALAHIAILAAGAYNLARALGCRPRYALLAAVGAPLSGWIFWWGAINWIPALVSMAWLVWAWGLLLQTARRPALAPLAASAVALTILSGWPFADLALVISAAAAGIIALDAPRSFRRVAWVGIALAAGGLLAAPAVLPLIAYTAFAPRGASPAQWSAGLPALLGFGTPLFSTAWRGFDDLHHTVHQPIVYVAWFAPLALVNADWRRFWKRPTDRLLIGATLAFGLLSMAPEVWQFQYMVRLLPYYQLGILLLAARALSDTAERGWNLSRSIYVVLAETYLAVCQSPESRQVFLLVGFGIAAAVWISTRLMRRDGRAWTVFALLLGLAVFEASAWTVAKTPYPQFPNRWAPPAIAAVGTGSSAVGPTRYAIYQLDSEEPGAAFWRTYEPGNTALSLAGGGSVVGYSPQDIQRFRPWFCPAHFGTLCPDAAARANAPVSPTGRSILDLAGVDQVDVQHEPDARAFAAGAGPTWSGSRNPAGGWQFLRNRSSGLVTWVSPGASAVVRSSAPSKIVLDARNAASEPGTLVIARAWYPGWTATLAGRPASARERAGLLLTVDLPPHSAGELKVSFWPAGLTAGLVLAIAGVAMMLVASLFPRLVDSPADLLESWLGRRGEGVQCP